MVVAAAVKKLEAAGVEEVVVVMRSGVEEEIGRASCRERVYDDV